MNILVVHEVDWLKKVIFEPHHMAELFSLKGNNVYAVDCRDVLPSGIGDGLKLRVRECSRIYENSRVTLFSPPSLLLPGLNRLYSYFHYEGLILKIAREKEIDAILLYGVATNGRQALKVARRLKIPIFYRLLDISHELVRIPVLQQVVKSIERKVIREATRVLPTTPALVRYATSMGASPSSTEAFPLGIKLKDFRPLPPDESLRRSLKMAEDDRIVLFMGTLYDFAGLDSIIQNFDLLKSQIPRIKLLIVGDGPASNSLKSLIRQKGLQGDVVITGFISQEKVPGYIALADLCLNPFRINNITRDILPTKILEYFGCKKAVLSTPLAGTRELLPDASFGIEYAEEDGFLDAIVAMLQDSSKLNKMGEDGFSYVTKNHDWDLLSDSLLNMFRVSLDSDRRRDPA